MSKRAAIDKLIKEANGTKTLSGTKLPSGTVSVRLPQQLTGNDSPHGSGQVRRQTPKDIIPGLTRGQRHGFSGSEILPAKPLVCLPCEPNTKRALRYTSKGHFRFLELPGELRNKVYDYAMVKQYYEIGWVDGNHKSKSLTYGLPRLGNAYGPRLDLNAARLRRQLDCSRRVLS